MNHSWFSGACDQCWPAVAATMSVGNFASGFEKAHTPRNEDNYAVKDHEIPCYTRRRDDELCLFWRQNKTNSTFSSGEKAIRYTF